MRKIPALLLTAALTLSLCACGGQASGDLVQELGLNAESKEAAEATVQVNSALYDLLDFEDTQEADFATRGLIDAPEVLELTDETATSSGARRPTPSWRTPTRPPTPSTPVFGRT